MLLVTFLAGAYPGLALSGFRPAESLKGVVDARRAGGFSLRRILVGTQFAISQALIIGAVVVAAQMEYVRNADLGFRKEGIVNLPLPGNDATKLAALRQQISAIAGVENLSFCMQPPASNANWNTAVRFDGRTEKEPWDINFKFSDEQFIATFGLKVIAGRNLSPSDTTREYLVTEEVVKRLGLAPAEDILGKLLYVDNVPFPVVGVVGNFHNHSMHEAIQPQVIASNLDNYDVCAVRLNLRNPQPALAAIEKVWVNTFPDHYFEYDFMDQRVADFYREESIIMQLIRLFAGLAVFIGCLGLYGLAAFMVARKTKEIGVRKTLGASVAGILWLFGKEYSRLIAVSFLVAAPLAWWGMNAWLDNYQYRIPIGADIFLIALSVTFLIATLTVGVQSVRAALANPVRSLRSE
jgi:putative ABC transport system permease protein